MIVRTRIRLSHMPTNLRVQMPFDGLRERMGWLGERMGWPGERMGWLRERMAASTGRNRQTRRLG